MAKNTPRITLRTLNNKARTVSAEELCVELAPDRHVVIDLRQIAAGRLQLRAESAQATPVMTLQLLGPNVVDLMVAGLDVHPDTLLTPPVLKLHLQKALEDEDAATPRPRKGDFKRWAQAALEQDAELTLRLVGAEEGRSLNRDFRGKDYATNVLTFVYGEGEPMPGESVALQGDVVLCVPVVLAEAHAQGKDPIAHYAHLTVHGMLHLQGYDHETDDEAARMEALETRILAGLGFSDPYAQT